MMKLVSIDCRWQFFSESGDIAFCVFFQSEEDTVELFPKERYECHLIMEEGRVPCECPGTCMLHAIYNQLLQFYYSIISLSIQIW